MSDFKDIERDKFFPFVCPNCLSENVMPPDGWAMMRANVRLYGGRTIMLTLECQDCTKRFVERYLKCYVSGEGNEYIG